MKLYEQIPIDTWKEIAYNVQRLNISDCSDEEFEKNLKQLEKLLRNSNICLENSSREPKEEQEIGLASLLQSIYDIGVESHCKKATFYEKIYELSDLGIQSMEFRPVEFPEGIYDIKSVYTKRKIGNGIYIDKEPIQVSKFYTDGQFDLINSHYNRNVTNYEVKLFDIQNIADANYLLIITLDQDYQNNIVMRQKEASLKNFNGKFPDREEVMAMRHPKILVPTQVQEWGEQLEQLKEIFKEFDEEDLSCRKMLTRTKNYQYYYRQSKNNK